MRRIAATRTILVALSLALLFAAVGCSSTGGSASSNGESTSAPSEPALPPGMAALPASSRLNRVELGMTPTEVERALGAGEVGRSYPTGKNWIPFYFGGDTFRTEWRYRNVGRVVFGNTSRFSPALKVVDVIHNPEEP